LSILIADIEPSNAKVGFVRRLCENSGRGPLSSRSFLTLEKKTIQGDERTPVSYVSGENFRTTIVFTQPLRTADFDPDRAEGLLWFRNAWRLGQYCLTRPTNKIQKIRCLESKMRDVTHEVTTNFADNHANGRAASLWWECGRFQRRRQGGADDRRKNDTALVAFSSPTRQTWL